MLIISESGDTENIGEKDIWERIRIIETMCWEMWGNYTPKDKKNIINR